MTDPDHAPMTDDRPAATPGQAPGAAPDPFPWPGHGPRLLAVCAGRAAPLFVTEDGRSESVATAIRKTALSTIDRPVPVPVRPLGIDGDEQVDQSVHGGLDQAVYVYPVEHYAFWTSARAQAHRTEPLEPGAMGENLLVSGLSEATIRVGDRLEIGDVVLRVTRPRSPCFKFNARMGFAWASKMMVQSGYTGFYCAVVRPGELAAGRPVHVRAGDGAATIGEIHRMKHRSPQKPLF